MPKEDDTTLTVIDDQPLLSMRIATPDDLLEMEKHIRRFARCNTHVCAALRTANYKSVKDVLLLRMQNVITQAPPAEIFLDNMFILRVDEDATAITIRMASTARAAVQPADPPDRGLEPVTFKRPRKSAAAAAPSPQQQAFEAELVRARREAVFSV